MKKILKKVTLAILIITLIIPLTVNAEFIPTAQTPYAQEFINKSQNQKWFLDEIEKYLNQEQKTINKLNSKEELNNITSLGLTTKNINGQIPQAIGELTNLKYLYLANNQIELPLPNELYTLANLENIDLSNNNLEGNIPKQLGQMPNLKILNLKQNKLTGNIPQTIQNNTKITNLNLMENKLTGEIPLRINNMTNLEYLNLSQNDLGGTLPNLANLKKLKALSLWYTNIKGEIDPSIYSLTNLQILDLAENALEGTLSKDIGNLNNLEHLTIADNQIKGEIPVEIENLQKLQTINLSNNLLRGTVPDIFDMPKLEKLDIKNNYLRGHLPESIKKAYENKAIIYAQNNYLTGENLRLIENNEKNFLDKEPNEQYQLIIDPNIIKISLENQINIYPNLKNLNITTQNQIQKEKLTIEEYTIIDNNNLQKAEITIDQKGINIKAKEEIKQSENYKITIKIKDNTNSDYSKITLQLTTETISIGGGGGGGALPNPPEQIEEEQAKVPSNHKAYIKGYENKNFRPDNHITREETAAMLITAMDITTEKTYASKYNDVEKTRWSINHIEETRKRTYLIGYQNNHFKPENKITRAELAAALVSINQKENLIPKSIKEQPEDTKEPQIFKDVKQDTWYYKHIQNAWELGLIKGYEDGSFKPEQSITRAEAVTMINQMLHRDSDTLNTQLIINPFNDVKADHWAYKQILEAATSHQH